MLSWSILQYFWPALSDNRSWKPILVFFWSDRLRQVLLYGHCRAAPWVVISTKWHFIFWKPIYQSFDANNVFVRTWNMNMFLFSYCCNQSYIPNCVSQHPENNLKLTRFIIYWLALLTVCKVPRTLSWFQSAAISYARRVWEWNKAMQ